MPLASTYAEVLSALGIIPTIAPNPALAIASIMLPPTPPTNPPNQDDSAPVTWPATEPIAALMTESPKDAM